MRRRDLSWHLEASPFQAGRPRRMRSSQSSLASDGSAAGPPADVNPFLDALRAGLAP